MYPWCSISPSPWCNKTSYIFSNPIVYKIIYDDLWFKDIRENGESEGKTIDCDDVISSYFGWRQANDDYPWFENEINAYLHSCSTIPESIQEKIEPGLVAVEGSSESDTDYDHEGFLGSSDSESDSDSYSDSDSESGSGLDGRIHPFAPVGGSKKYDVDSETSDNDSNDDEKAGGSRVSFNYLSIAFLGAVTIISAFFKR